MIGRLTEWGEDWMTKQEELHEAFAITGQVNCHTDLEKNLAKVMLRQTNTHIYFFPLVGALRSKRRNTTQIYIYFK